MANLVLIGADGMLGRAFCELFGELQLEHVALCPPGFDLARAEHIAALPLGPQTQVVNCGAWTDVDGAEAREAEATAINGLGVGMLAERCAQTGSTLLHFSTDYVFAGDSRTPYAVYGLQQPLGAYGRSKAEGERRLWAAGPEALVVRTSWLYAPWGKNFVRTIAKLAKERPELRVVDDQRGRPTSAQHLAKTSWALLQARVRGVVHVTDGGECTWFEFAQTIAARVAPACQVRPCTTAEFPRPAPRPPYSVLDLSRVEGILGAMPHWHHHLDAVLAQLGAAS